MTKNQFKKQYSAYRLELRNVFHLGYESYQKVFESNETFRQMKSKFVYPVSPLVHLYLNKHNYGKL